MKVYVVIEEGYKGDGYGTSPCIIGVFDSIDQAEEIIKNSIDPERPRWIIEIEKNKEFSLEPSEYWKSGVGERYTNDYCVGCYIE